MSTEPSGSKRQNNESLSPIVPGGRRCGFELMRPVQGSVQLVQGVGLVFAGACCLVWLRMLDSFPSNWMRVTLNLSFALVAGAMVGVTMACFCRPQSIRSLRIHALLGVFVGAGMFAASPLNAMVRGVQTRNPALYSTGGMMSGSEPRDVIEGGEPYYWTPVDSVMTFRQAVGGLQRHTLCIAGKHCRRMFPVANQRTCI